jgi:hypothetical protein
MVLAGFSQVVFLQVVVTSEVPLAVELVVVTSEVLLAAEVALLEEEVVVAEEVAEAEAEEDVVVEAVEVVVIKIVETIVEVTRIDIYSTYLLLYIFINKRLKQRKIVCSFKLPQLMKVWRIKI